MTRNMAITLIRQHSIEPNACMMGGNHKCLLGLNTTDDPCESFDSALGIHNTYKLADVMNWLGY